MSKRQPLPKEPLRLMAISTSGCAGWWCQESPGRGVLFLPAQVSKDSADNVLVLNASNATSDCGIIW